MKTYRGVTIYVEDNGFDAEEFIADKLREAGVDCVHEDDYFNLLGDDDL